MKVYECSPYYNEELIAQIKIKEAANWIDEFHVTESNKTFTYKDKDYNFKYACNDMVKYHQIDGKKHFKSPRWGLSKTPWFIKFKTFPWCNEAIQRNLSCSCIHPNDDDVVVLTDLDEIVDSRYADKVIEEVKKHQVVALKLHYTEYFFNLYVDYRLAPIHHWCFRSYAMTGKYFNIMKTTSDQLRRMGTDGVLTNQVHCMEDYVGFHHSWIGDEQYCLNKLAAYSHDHNDHAPELYLNKNEVNVEFLNKCLHEKKSIWGKDHKLFADSSIKLMDSV